MIKILIDIIQDPIKALVASLTGTVVGYIPNAASAISNTKISSFDRSFQHGVWFLTCLVAITALVSFIQKQVDRYRKNHKPK